MRNTTPSYISILTERSSWAKSNGIHRNFLSETTRALNENTFDWLGRVYISTWASK